MNELETTWKREGTRVAAAEFVSSCLVAGERHRGRVAAQSLIKSSNPAFGRLGQASEAPSVESGLALAEISDLEAHFRRKIAFTKLRTIRDPRNALAWADLARRYTALGHFEQADRALRVSLSIAPHSRYLLRVCTKFLVQIGEPDRAIRLLQRSPRTPTDPWLTAALLSVELSAGQSPSGIRRARKITEDPNFLEIERSELRSELATIELQSGGNRRARKLFRSSLNEPTDNALAQVAWASNQVHSLDLSFTEHEVPFDSEARCRAAAQSGNWEDALSNSSAWLDDQPFDAEAAVFASYAAAVGMEDWLTSRRFAEFGLRSNSNNVALLNNFAFAVAHLGDLDEAAKALSKARSHSSRGEAIAITATSGLLKFRSGDYAEGRRLYEAAIAKARKLSEHEAEAMARAMLLEEERRVDLPVDVPHVEILGAMLDVVKDPGVLRVMTVALDHAKVGLR